MRLVVLLGALAVGCDATDVDTVVDAARDDAGPDAGPADAPPDATPEPGSLILSPSAIAHGLIRVGDLVGASITISNPSQTSAAPLDSIGLTGTGFSMSTTCGATLPAGSDCTIAVEITPQALITYAATVTVTSSGIAREVPLSAVGAWELTVAQAGLGGGTFLSTPSGIACHGTCSHLFTGPVELDVEPDPGSTVRAWSIPACSGLACSVAPSLDGRTVTAYFQLGRPINVTREGSGTITSSPAGIDCGSSCSYIFEGEVTLTATPYVGQTFEGWSELSCGTNPTCVIPAGNDSVDITARFSTTSTTSIDLTLAGDAEGEVVVYRGGSRVARCTSSCSILVAAGELTIVGATPYRLESLSGTGCVPDGDRCVITPLGTAQITATFRRDPRDRWMFLGLAGEKFAKGAFDAAGNLIAGSQQRIVKLGPGGALLWERPWSGGEIVVAASGVSYVTDSRGTVKLDPTGGELWIRPGRPSALDSMGNVLVVDHDTGAARMTLYQPDGTPLWSAAGAGTGIDGTGTIYEPFIERVMNEGDDHYHLVLHMHRYDALGAPLPDLGSWGGVEEWGEYHVVVTANRLAVLERDEWSFSTLKLGVIDLATNQSTHHVESLRAQLELMQAFITGAGDDIGFAHEPDEILMDSFFGYGYQLERLRSDGSMWTLLRIPPASDTRDVYYGPQLGGVAGGPGRELAMLGAYEPLREWNEPAATVGMIQTFAP